jgi:hypothetical protein
MAIKYAIILAVLNALDAVSTVFLIRNGAVEINPLMNALLQYSEILFVLVKFFMVGGAIIWLSTKKPHLSVWQGLVSIYLLVTGWHVWLLATLFFQ